MASKPDQPKKPTRAKRNARNLQASAAEQNSIKPESTPADENTIRARRTRSPSHPTKDPKPKSSSEERGATDTDSRAVPEHINTRYIKVGNKYHFANGDLAFSDRGRGLSTRLENTEVISDLIAIAKERGWNDIALGGTARFRKEAWQQGQLAGLAVRGYRPSELERAQLARLIGRERGEVQESPAPHSIVPPQRLTTRSAPSEEAARTEIPQSTQAPDRVHAGRLLDHGTANYRFDRHADLSYFVKIDTPDGERTLWGKDLERAVQQSLSRVNPGHEVVVRQLGAKPVTVIRPIRDQDGRIVDRTQVQTHLNRWSVERVDFLTDRTQAAQIVRDPSIDAGTATAKRPELAGTYTELHAAKLIAQELFAHPTDRERFISRVRDAIADEIERGEPLSAPRVRNRTQDQQQNRPRIPEHAQERVL